MMSRPATLLALFFAVVGGIFLFANVAAPWGMYLIVAALVLVIVGVLTGK